MMVYKNSCGNMETKRVSVKKVPSYAKHSSARPYIRKTVKLQTLEEIKNYEALCA